MVRCAVLVSLLVLLTLHQTTSATRYGAHICGAYSYNTSRKINCYVEYAPGAGCCETTGNETVKYCTWQDGECPGIGTCHGQQVQGQVVLSSYDLTEQEERRCKEEQTFNATISSKRLTVKFTYGFYQLSCPPGYQLAVSDTREYRFGVIICSQVVISTSTSPPTVGTRISCSNSAFYNTVEFHCPWYGNTKLPGGYSGEPRLCSCRTNCRPVNITCIVRKFGTWKMQNESEHPSNFCTDDFYYVLEGGHTLQYVRSTQETRVLCASIGGISRTFPVDCRNGTLNSSELSSLCGTESAVPSTTANPRTTTKTTDYQQEKTKNGTNESSTLAPTSGTPKPQIDNFHLPLVYSLPALLVLTVSLAGLLVYQRRRLKAAPEQTNSNIGGEAGDGGATGVTVENQSYVAWRAGEEGEMEENQLYVHTGNNTVE